MKILGVLVLLIASLSLCSAQTESVLYTFLGGPPYNSNTDGEAPQSSLTPDGNGNFYGTTCYGGFGYGIVYEMSPSGSIWTESIIHNFDGVDGLCPYYSGVTFDKSGNLYGVTYWGGAYGFGSVYELSPSESGWQINVLYSFPDYSVGSPSCTLAMDSNGNLFGQTWNSTGGNIVVFELSLQNGVWQEQTIYTAVGGDMSSPAIDSANNIFFVTGISVVELSPSVSGWTHRTVHKFTGQNWPIGTLTLDSNDDIYGVNSTGGWYGDGSVYKLTYNGKRWTKKTLHSFSTPQLQSGKDGSAPMGGVIVDQQGYVYGTTFDGGMYNRGTVFALVPNPFSTRYKEEVLWSFEPDDGGWPESDLVLGSGGNLFGVTAGGGYNWGTVFEVFIGK